VGSTRALVDGGTVLDVTGIVTRSMHAMVQMAHGRTNETA
jgi:hypothetical protein